MGHSFEGFATLLGFTLGVSSAGIALTDGVLFLLVTVNTIARVEGYYPSLPSAIALTFSIVTIALSFFLVRGALWIWRFSVYGGALNLSLGFVLVITAYGVVSFVFSQIADNALNNFLLVSYVIASAFSITSGLLGSMAHHEQLTRRFERASSSSMFKVKVSVDGVLREVEVSGNTRGRDLKEKVCKMEGISKEDARLLFGGRAVDDSVSLKEIGAGEGDQFTLIK
jgi:hypothetical protein